MDLLIWKMICVPPLLKSSLDTSRSLSYKCTFPLDTEFATPALLQQHLSVWFWAAAASWLQTLCWLRTPSGWLCLWVASVCLSQRALGWPKYTVWALVAHFRRGWVPSFLAPKINGLLGKHRPRVLFLFVIVSYLIVWYKGGMGGKEVEGNLNSIWT